MGLGGRGGVAIASHSYQSLWIRVRQVVDNAGVVQFGTGANWSVNTNLCID